MLQFLRRLYTLTRRRRLESDLAAELEFHRAMKQLEFEGDGLNSADASFAAQRALGNRTLALEDARAVWVWTWWDSFQQDVTRTLRGFRRQPAVTIAIIVAMSTGIAVTTAMFAIVNGVLLRPFPYREQDRLFALWQSDKDAPRFVVTAANFLDWKHSSRTFADMAAIQLFRDRSMALAGAGATPEQVESVRVSWNIFDVLGVSPAVGRAFSAEDGMVGRNHVVLLGNGLWKRRFGGLPSVVGTPIVLNGVPLTIIGVLPEHFQLPLASAEVFTPLAWNAAEASERTAAWIGVIGRLRPDASPEQAQAELSVIAGSLERTYPATNAGQTVAIDPLYETLVGDVEPTLLMLFATATILMLLGSAAVANLLLARLTRRRKELAIQASIGATSRRIARQLFTEAAVLAVCAAVLGTGLARYVVESVLAIAPASTFFAIPRREDIALDGHTWVFAAAVMIVSACLVGWPSARAPARLDIQAVLNDESGGSSASRHQRVTRRLLMISQSALALILIVVTTLAAISYGKLRSVDLGFQTGRTVAARISLPIATYGDDARVARFYRSLLRGIASAPGVQGVSLVNLPPLGGVVSTNGVHVVGMPEAPISQWPGAINAVVAPTYFELLHIALIRGRTFTSRDDNRSPPVAIVSQGFAARFFPNADPIGQQVVIRDSGRNPREIVGVVGDVKARTLVRPSMPQIYVPFEQLPQRTATVLMSASSDLVALAPIVRAAVADIDRTQAVGSVRPMQALVDDASAKYTVTTFVFATFGLAAIVMSLSALYGMTMQATGERRQEVGIRLALGATQRHVLRVLIQETVIFASAGTAVGMTLSWMLARFMENILFGVQAQEPAVFLCAAVGSVVVATLCALGAAGRSVRIDPVEALRRG
jgi:putative ABC transport system permease protein